MAEHEGLDREAATSTSANQDLAGELERIVAGAQAASPESKEREAYHGFEISLDKDRLASSDLSPTDTLLVPTNNIVLASCSDLPRLDLAHPERGIHRPSAYGELFQLVKAA